MDANLSRVQKTHSLWLHAKRDGDAVILPVKKAMQQRDDLDNGIKFTLMISDTEINALSDAALKEALDIRVRMAWDELNVKGKA